MNDINKQISNYGFTMQDFKDNPWLYDLIGDNPVWIKFIDNKGNSYGPVKGKIIKPKEHEGRNN